MQITVKIFKNRSADFGDPNKLLAVSKLSNPTLSCGNRKKIRNIRNTLKTIALNGSIEGL